MAASLPFKITEHQKHVLDNLFKSPFQSFKYVKGCALCEADKRLNGD